MSEGSRSSGTSLWRRLGFSLRQNTEEFLELLNPAKQKTSQKSLKTYLYENPPQKWCLDGNGKRMISNKECASYVNFQ